MKFQCPVCGFDDISGPRLKWSICPSCGTQFGLTDANRTPGEIRAYWISQGAKWQSTARQRPRNWNPAAQLRTVGYCVTAEDLLAMALQTTISTGKFSLPYSGLRMMVVQAASEFVAPNFAIPLESIFPEPTQSELVLMNEV